MGTGNYSVTSNNMKFWYTGRWWVDVTFDTARRGPGRMRQRPGPSSLYQM